MDYFRKGAIGASETQAALIYAGRLLADWPGEKALVWVSAGTTTDIWTVPLQVPQVKVYPLDVHTKMTYEFVASFPTAQTTYQYETEVNNQLLQNMYAVAEETRGEVCGTAVEPEVCISEGD